MTSLIYLVVPFVIPTVPVVPAAALVSAGSATPESDSAAIVLVDDFVGDNQNLLGDKVEFIRRQWDQRRTAEQAPGFLIEALSLVSEPFRQGMESYAAEQYQACVDALKAPAADANPYLSANALAYQIKSLAELDDSKLAAEKLAELEARFAVPDDYTFLAAEMSYLTGYCHLRNLEYGQAAGRLERFLRDYPEAPDRLRMSARQILQELGNRRKEGLDDVTDLMDYAGDRLAQKDAGDDVQNRQNRAVELLDKLIEEAENQEKNNSGGSGNSSGRSGRSSTPKGNQQPSAPANRSSLPGGASSEGDLHRAPRVNPGEMWGQMRPEERDRVLQTLKESFPGRYRDLVEQYYRDLSKQP